KRRAGVTKVLASGAGTRSAARAGSRGGAAGQRGANSAGEQGGKRGGAAGEEGRREHDRRAATVFAEGARASRGTDRRACEGAAGARDAAGAVKQDGRR